VPAHRLLEQQVESLSATGAPVSVTGWNSLNLPMLRGHLAGFRVTATASAGKRKTPVYYDLILVGQSRALTKVVFSSLNEPFPARAEARLATAISRRL
jgi:hypothetical protein